MSGMKHEKLLPFIFVTAKQNIPASYVVNNPLCYYLMYI